MQNLLLSSQTSSSDGTLCTLVGEIIASPSHRGDLLRRQHRLYFGNGCIPLTCIIHKLRRGAIQQEMSETMTHEMKYSGDQILRQKFGTPDIPVQSILSKRVSRYLESFDYFFIATSNRKGECDASYRE